MQKQQKENNKFFLKYIDIFGVNPKLYINKKEKYRSSWGGFLTLSLLGCVIVACWIYGKDMYYRQKPLTIFTEIANSHPSRYNITKENFNFAFGLQNSKRINFIDESIYTLKLQQEIVTVAYDEQGNSKKQFEQKDIKVRPCQESDFLVDPQFFTNFFGFQNLYCIDDYKQVDLHIEGDFGADYYGNISGKLYPCKNSTDSQIICKPQEVIDQELSENQYTMNFSDQILDPKIYETPFKSVGRNLYGLISKNEFRQFLMQYRNVYLEDNTGIIFDNISIKSGLQFSYETELYRSKPKDDGNFFQFVIRFEKVKETKIYRSYLNIAAVIASVGGILKILMIVFTFISAYVARQMYNLQLANTVFKFQQNSQENEYQQSGDDINDNNKKTNSQLTFKSYLHLLFPWCANRQVKQDKILLNYAVDKMTQKLDIHYILDKLIDIEKIKLLLLDNDQHKLFDYISKPEINNDLVSNKRSIERQKTIVLDLDQSDQINQVEENDKFNNIMLVEEKTISQKNREALNAYNKLNRKKDKNILDKKMLNLMDAQMYSLFQSKITLGQIQRSNINMDSNNVNIQNINNKNDSQNTKNVNQFLNNINSQYNDSTFLSNNNSNIQNNQKRNSKQDQNIPKDSNFKKNSNNLVLQINKDQDGDQTINSSNSHNVQEIFDDDIINHDTPNQLKEKQQIMLFQQYNDEFPEQQHKQSQFKCVTLGDTDLNKNTNLIKDQKLVKVSSENYLSLSQIDEPCIKNQNLREVSMSYSQNQTARTFLDNNKPTQNNDNIQYDKNINFEDSNYDQQ